MGGVNTHHSQELDGPSRTGADVPQCERPLGSRIGADVRAGQ